LVLAVGVAPDVSLQQHNETSRKQMEKIFLLQWQMAVVRRDLMGR
jgi:type II secretory pathway component PulJ